MMRYDPTDLDDLAFVVGQSGCDPAAVAGIVQKARLPDSVEIHEQFMLCRGWLARQGLCSP